MAKHHLLQDTKHKLTFQLAVHQLFERFQIPLSLICFFFLNRTQTKQRIRWMLITDYYSAIQTMSTKSPRTSRYECRTSHSCCYRFHFLDFSCHIYGLCIFLKMWLLLGQPKKIIATRQYKCHSVTGCFHGNERVLHHHIGGYIIRGYSIHGYSIWGTSYVTPL